MLKQTQSLGETSSSAFYITGGTLRGDAACYVRRRADESLFESLSQGQFCYVLTSRQMGKSSLMIRTAERLRESGTGVVVLDLTAVGQNLTAEQWYDGLLNRVGRQLQLEDELESFWLANPRLGPLQRWMNAITEVVLPRYPGKLVIFIDEIDTVRSLPFTTDEFFAGIREFYNRRTSESELERLTFCLLGVASPSDLIRDTRMTPFNVGSRIELNDFTEDEAAPLAQGLGRDEKAGSEILNRVLYWTGGHPYLTQRLCLTVAKDDSVIDAKGVDNKCEELFFTRRAQDGDDNLVFVRERILRSDVELAGLLTMYDQVHSGRRIADDETSPLVSTLHLSGITRVENSRLKVRNRIYERVFDRDWVKEHMPDAELRRQQAAYRKGLMRAAGVATAIVLTFATLAYITFQQMNIAKAEANRADLNLKRATLSDEEARKALTVAEQQRNVAINRQMFAEIQRNLADQQRLRAEKQEEANRQILYSAQMNLAMQAWNESSIPTMEELLNNHIPKPGQKDLRGFEWYFLWRLCYNGLRTLQQPGSINDITFSPSGRILAAVSGVPHIVKLWDTVTGKALHTLTEHILISSIAFSPDEKRIITGHYDGTWTLWDVATGHKESTIPGNRNQVTAMRFSPNSKFLAFASTDGIVRLWETNTGKESSTLKGHTDRVITLAFSPDMERLAVLSRDKIVKIWDIVTGQILATFKIDVNVGQAVRPTMAFSPNGKLLALGNNVGSVKLWDWTAEYEPVILKGSASMVGSLAFSPDGKTLATGSRDGTLKLWDVTGGQEIITMTKHSSAVTAVAFSPDGRTLATAGLDSTIKLWDLAALREPAYLKSNPARILSLAFTPDGKTLATAGYRVVRLWDMVTGQEKGALTGHNGVVLSVKFSRDGKRLVTGNADGTAKLWDVATGQVLRTFIGHTIYPYTVAISPNDKIVAAGSLDKTVKLWEVATGLEIITLKSHTSYVWAISFSPDGKILATAGADATIKLWDTATWQELITLKGHEGGIEGIAFSPDGKRLASSSNDRIAKLWDVITGRELMTFKGHGSWVNCVAFSPDGARLATGSSDNTVRLWDPATGQEKIKIRANTNEVWSVIFSPDGKNLISGGDDGTLKIWRAATEVEVQTSIFRK